MDNVVWNNRRKVNMLNRYRCKGQGAPPPPVGGEGKGFATDVHAAAVRQRPHAYVVEIPAREYLAAGGAADGRVRVVAVEGDATLLQLADAG